MLKDRSNSDTNLVAPVQLLQDLVRFDTTSPPGNEEACITYVKRLLDEAEIKTTVLAKDSKRPNLIARLTGEGNAPPLLLQGHVDVWPTENQIWKHPPFGGKVTDDFVWGRGTLDMKSGVAMMVSAVIRAKVEGLHLPGDVILAVLSDEERLGYYGAKFLVEDHAGLFERVRYAIGELGGFTLHLGSKRFYPISVTEKQVCIFKLVIQGTGEHPFLGIRGGVMARSGEVLKRLDTLQMPIQITPVTQMTIERIVENLAHPTDLLITQLLNPESARSAMQQLGSISEFFAPMLSDKLTCIRIHGNESQVELKLVGFILPDSSSDELLNALGDIKDEESELETTLQGEPAISTPDMGLFGILEDIITEADPSGIPVPYILPAVSDGRFFAQLGIQTYGFTPMKLPRGFDLWQTIHAADERIPVEAVQFGTDALYQLLSRFGG